MPGSTPNTLIRNLTLKGPGANLLTISGEYGRLPRLPVVGAMREHALQVIADALAKRPEVQA